MSKYFLDAEKKLKYVREGLQKLMVIEGQCQKAMQSSEEEEHHGVAIVAGLLLKNILCATTEIEDLFKENASVKSDSTTEKA